MSVRFVRPAEWAPSNTAALQQTSGRQQAGLGPPVFEEEHAVG